MGYAVYIHVTGVRPDTDSMSGDLFTSLGEGESMKLHSSFLPCKAVESSEPQIMVAGAWSHGPP